MFFVSYCINPSIWRDETVQLAEEDGLYSAMGESLIRVVSKAIEGGLLQGYSNVADIMMTFRGRVDVKEHILRHRGRPLPLPMLFDDFSIDTADNQIMLLAILRLLALPDGSESMRQRLRRLRVAFDGVTSPAHNHGRPEWHRTRLNSRYHDALALSTTILDECSVDQRKGPVPVSGFMFDMWRIYEDFVVFALSNAMASHGGRADFQTTIWLDEDKRIQMRPDMLWRSATGDPLAVVDAKYKAEQPKGFPEHDVYQMLAYCTALGLPEGHLVYAKGNEPSRTHVVVRADIEIHCHALDLSLHPAKLLQRIGELAAFTLRDQTALPDRLTSQ